MGVPAGVNFLVCIDGFGQLFDPPARSCHIHWQAEACPVTLSPAVTPTAKKYHHSREAALQALQSSQTIYSPGFHG